MAKKKIEAVSVVLYSFQGYGKLAEYISTVTIPVETVYEIKGAVELLRAKKINHNYSY
ncbi:MAG: hypothetical protein QXJ06_05970 [Candidatus Aenigmatarchaeota archaeon]